MSGEGSGTRKSEKGAEKGAGKKGPDTFSEKGAGYIFENVSGPFFAEPSLKLSNWLVAFACLGQRFQRECCAGVGEEV